MTQLSTTAAYVRKSTRTPHIRAFWKSMPDSLDVQLLDLLQTPHTVDSLTRVLSQDLDDREEESSDALGHRVSWSMRRLLEDDLIELSPDS